MALTKKTEVALLLHLCIFASPLRVSYGFLDSTAPMSLTCCCTRSVSRRRRRHLSASIHLPDQAEEHSPTPRRTDFWGRELRPKDADADQSRSLPHVPSLDAHGELPLGAYILHGNPSHAQTEICRISLALDSQRRRPDDEFDIPTIVRSLQDYLDDGFQTFQVKSGPGQQHTFVERDILGRFFDETPAFARERCSVVIPLRIPLLASGAGMNPTFVRRHITASLQRTGLEAIDCVQVQHRKNSPYLFDILDILEELKREGLVGSVSARNLPPGLVREAKSNGFEIHTGQLDMNVLDPTSSYDTEHKLMCSDLGITTIAASPLAGALLSDRYRQDLFKPLSTQLSLNGNRYVNTILPMWNARFTDANKTKPWDRFHAALLPALGHIALKHRVSIATVCLRWLLQLKHVSTAAISYNLLDTTHNEDELKTSKRIKAFRDVFRFELDDEDIKEIWELSGVEEPADDFALSFDDNEEEQAVHFEQRNGLYLP